MKKILVTGSLAYDNIMNFDGEFRDFIIPANLDTLSVSFLANTRERYFGGTAGNIAYSLKLLGEEPLIVSVAGNDFEEYRNWFDENGISTETISISERNPTAAAFILSDKRQSQITIFSPAAMQNEDLAFSFEGINLEGVELAIIAADLPTRIVALAAACKEKKIPYIFDPGQAMSALSPSDLWQVAASSAGLLLNEYETKLFIDRVGKRISEINVPFLIETLGEKGANVHQGGEVIYVPTNNVENIVDATGCGDGFRAGFLHGLANNKPIEEAVRYGHFVARLVLQHPGTQLHSFSKEDLSNFLAS